MDPLKHENSPYDVLIIGGGPAGSTAATLLAKAGRRVLVVEKERFPRFHIGESMLPNSMGTFDRLGVKEKLDQVCLPKIGAEFATVCGYSSRFEFKNAFRAKYPRAYQGERAVFDQVLLDHSRECGAEVREETVVEQFEEAQECIKVRVRSNGAEEAAWIEAKYLLDCSGRNSVVGSHFHLKSSYPTLKKVAIYAHYEGVTRDANITRLVRGKAFWFWIIPINEKLTSIGLVMDTADLQARKMSPEEVLGSALSEQPMMQERLRSARRTTKVHSTSDYSYRNARLRGQRWLLAGDAAGFIDPIFSTGVFLAVMSGERAADTLNEVLEEPRKRSALFSRYERHLQRVMNMYLRFVQGWYTPEFAEVFASPTEHFQLTAAVNAVLTGDVADRFGVWWRMEVFYLVVLIQRYFRLVPRLTLQPRQEQSIVES